MFWRFGFSSTSSLDTLLDKPNVSLEEILDEDELLQECKTQNSKLVNYLQQPRVLKRLFEHVTGTAEVGGPGGREWEEKVRFKYPYICSEVLSCDIWSIIDTALSNSDELLVPFWDAILTSQPYANPPSLPQHMHPLFSSPPTAPSSPRLNVTNMPTLPGQDRDDSESSNVGVLGLEVKRTEDKRVTSAKDNGPGKSVLAGYWAKVNGVFLDKKPKEMLDFIRGLPRIIEKFVAHLETPAVVDLLYRIIQCEESVSNADVVDWLSGQDLIPRVVNLLSPSYSSDLHNTVSELLKAIISLSAPSPANLTQGQGAEAFGFSGSDGFGGSGSSVCGVNNRLVRELASGVVVRKMVGFMLDSSLPSQLVRRLSQAADEQLDSISLDVGTLPDRAASKFRKPSAQAARASKLTSLSETSSDNGGTTSEESALEDEDLEEDHFPARKPLDPRDTPASEESGSSPAHRDSTVTIRPHDITPPVSAPQVEVSPESCTSTLVTCIGVLIELIRKNNSDYFEQHLFHTLRTHLLQRQQEIAERKTQDKPEKEGQQQEEEDDEMEGMEEAMAELSDKLGIVHLGPMLHILCERLPDFQRLLTRARLREDSSSLSESVPALTFERYRITELYAELLHCSNMALLNRAPGEGPQYNRDGILQGGIEGLQILARTLQGGDTSSDSGDGAANESGILTADAVRGERADEKGGPEEGAGEAVGEAVEAVEKAPTSRAHSRDATKHTRESSSTTVGPSNGSEDTDDEALLSEVSLSDATAGKTAATEGEEEEEEEDPFADAGREEEKDKAGEEGSTAEEDDEIRSALSTLSLADLTSPAPSGPPSPMDDAREYVVGDLLKKKFLESEVIGTILSLFFQYPWNNFLHNVVYDILQQFFNGRMDVGLNRRLTLAVFDSGGLTERIVEGHQRNEESLRSARRVRMGYMGHMNLIAEETVKLLERYPHEIGRHVKDHTTAEWQAYVNETLRENREKEAAPLAGGRPQLVHPLSFPSQQSGSSVEGVGGERGENDAFASYLTSQMGAGNTSDDDDSDEDASWLSQDIKQAGPSGTAGDGGARGNGFDDAFEPSALSGRRGQMEEEDDDDDDEWGPFADSTDAAGQSVAPGRASSSAQAYLTPADWASDFQRSTAAAEAGEETGALGGEVSSIDDPSSPTSAASHGDDEGERGSSGSADSTSSTPFIDLLDSASLRQTDVVAAAHARRPSLGQHEAAGSAANLVGGVETKRRASLSGSGSSDPTAANAADAEEPHGPGVASDARSNEETGMLERVIDGQHVSAPLDDVALMSAQAAEQREKEDESAVE